MKIYYSYDLLLGIDVILLSASDCLMPKLTASRATVRGRTEALSQMISELKKLPKPKNEKEEIAQVERVEGFFTYFAAYKLEGLIAQGDLLVGVLLSAALLEDQGKRKLKRIFAKKISPKQIDRLRLEETIMLLLVSGVINQKTYTKLTEIRKARNKLAHSSLDALKILLAKSSPESKEARNVKSTIRKAITCLKTIQPPSIS